MNALVTKSVVQQAMSVLTTQRQAIRQNIRGGFRSVRPAHTGLSILRHSARTLPISTASSDMLRISLKLVSAFGERTFTAYWH